MTPKQEALRLFDRFYNETLSHLSYHITREDAIQSALICVDEILQNKLTISNIDMHYYRFVAWHLLPIT